MSYECDDDNHQIGCQCPGIVIPDYREAVAEMRALINSNWIWPTLGGCLMYAGRWATLQEIAGILDRAERS